MSRLMRSRSSWYGCYSLGFSLLVFLCGTALLPTVQGFAAWLKCYVDLDPSEVIMNHQVEPAPNGYPLLAAYENGIRVQEADDGSGVIWFDDSEDGTPLTYQLRLDLGETNLADVQFAAETSEGGEFTLPGGVMCDGRRGHARGKNGEVTLMIDKSRPEVSVWGGWAQGHSPVTLTKPLVFRRRKDREL